jgi:hypothetical protein
MYTLVMELRKRTVSLLVLVRQFSHLTQSRTRLAQIILKSQDFDLVFGVSTSIVGAK